MNRPLVAALIALVVALVVAVIALAFAVGFVIGGTWSIQNAGSLWKAADTKLQADFVTAMATTTDPQTRREAVQALLRNRAQTYASTIGNSLVKQSAGKAIPPANKAAYYREKYQSVTPTIGPDGADMKAFNREREAILGEALKAGVKAEDVTFHKPLANLEAEKIVAAYRTDQLILLPYWNITDVVDQIPAYGLVKQDWDRATPEAKRSIEQQRGAWLDRKDAISEEHERLRRANKGIDDAIQRWYEYEPLGPATLPKLKRLPRMDSLPRLPLRSE